MTRTATPKKANHPDQWGDGLCFTGKTLNIKTVSRAATPADVMPTCLAHNLRQGNEDHRHRSAIDPARTHRNEVLRGPSSLAVALEVAQSILAEFDLTPRRADTIMGIELVFQPPDGADSPAFWTECLRWADARYQHVISAVVHRDQKRPHMHLLALAVADGRWAGHALTSGDMRTSLQGRDFTRDMREVLGIRRDRPAKVTKVKTLARLAVSTGRGPKTRAAAERRDAALLRLSTPEPPTAMPTPTAMPRNGHTQEGGSLFPWAWRLLAGEGRKSGASLPPMPPAPRPRNADQSAPKPTTRGATSQPPAPADQVDQDAAPADQDEAPTFPRDRDTDHRAGYWCDVRGEFVTPPQPAPRLARMAAQATVAALLGARHASH